MVGEELIPSNDNTVERNTITGHSGGISVIDSIGNDIVENRIGAENGGGITLELARETVVRANNLAGSKEGIVLDESAEQPASRSTTPAARSGPASRSAACRRTTTVCSTRRARTAARASRSHDSAPTGQGTVLEGNEADGNAGDGIAHRTASVTSSRTTARSATAAGASTPPSARSTAAATSPPATSSRCSASTSSARSARCRASRRPGSSTQPPLLSHSRNACFTYRGSDNLNFEHELVFECRIDSQDPFAWEDCEYPAEFINLSPGHAHRRDPRDRPRRLLADSTPAKLHVDLPAAAGERPARGHHRHRAAGRDLGARRALHVPLQRAGRHVRVQGRRVRLGAVRLRRAGVEMYQRRLRVGPRGDRGRPAHVLRPRDRLRGQRRRAGDATPGTCWGSPRLPARAEPESTGFTPPETPFDLATGGETLSTTAVIDFEANMADATFECSLDLGPFEPCMPPVTYENLLGGDHMLRVIATSGEMQELEAAEYEWGIVEGIDTDRADRDDRADAGQRLQHDDVRVHRHRRPDAARAAHVRVPHGQHERARLGGVRQPVQPARPLHVRGPADGAGPAHLRGARDRHGRAAVREPEQPELRGQRRPAGELHVDDDGRHDASGHGDPLRSGERLQDLARRARPRRTTRVRVLRQRQRDAGAPARRSSARSTSGRGSRASPRTSSATSSPASTPSRSARST